MAEDQTTVTVKVADDYNPAYHHVVLWDDSSIHPDAPVWITTESKESFEVSLTARVAQLINQGVLQRTTKSKRNADEAETDNTEQAPRNTEEAPEGVVPEVPDNPDTSVPQEVPDETEQKPSGRKASGNK